MKMYNIIIACDGKGIRDKTRIKSGRVFNANSIAKNQGDSILMQGSNPCQATSLGLSVLLWIVIKRAQRILRLARCDRSEAEHFYCGIE